MWASRLLALFYGLRAVGYRLCNNFGSYIDRSVKVTGWSNVHVGVNSAVGAGTWLNINDRNGAKDSIRIGNNCFIGRNNFVTVGHRVSFGDYCLTATNCAFVGSSHVIDDPTLPYITTGVDVEAEILIGANCFFGYGAMVLGAVKIGHGSVIGAGAVVLKDVPPFSVVIGNPAKVVKRYSFAKSCWVSVDEYDDEAVISEDEYSQLLHKNVGYCPLPISAASSFLGDV